MQAIIDGEKDIYHKEAMALYHLFSHFGNYQHYSPEYLFSPVLAVVDSKTNKGKWQLAYLQQKLKHAHATATPYIEDGTLDILHKYALKHADRLYQTMCQRHLATYARYRTSLIELNFLGDSINRKR